MSLLDPSNPIFVTGTDEDRAAARREWHQERFREQLRRSTLPELDPSTLKPHKFGILEDTTTGRLFKRRPDQIVDLDFAGESCVAYFIDESGPVLVENPPGPQSIQALEEQQAEQEARRNQPKPKPSWLTQ